MTRKEYEKELQDILIGAEYLGQNDGCNWGIGPFAMEDFISRVDNLVMKYYFGVGVFKDE